MPAMISEPPVGPAATPNSTPRFRRQLRSSQETQGRRRRVLAYALFLGALILMVNAVVGENGYLATLRARREYDSLMQALAKVQTENQRLRDEAQRLKTDPAAIEETARRELGLIRPGETLVIIRDARPDRPATGSGPAAADAARR